VDAFEHVVAELFWSEGYWVRTGVKIELTKEQKAELGNPSMPRPEIDLVAYRGSDNRLLAIECKSYLDSRGVTYAELCGEKASKTYKLFRMPKLRRAVLAALEAQLISHGFCKEGAKARLGLVAGKIYSNDEPQIRDMFASNGWLFCGPKWLRERLTERSAAGYENQISSVVAKLLLRAKGFDGGSAPETSPDDLISRITPDNVHPEMDWGPDVGKERWWEDR
jgi:hypothetical protein